MKGFINIQKCRSNTKLDHCALGRGGFQFFLILDLWSISFHAVIVFGLCKNLLFKSGLGHCDKFVLQLEINIQSLDKKKIFVGMNNVHAMIA